MTNNWEKLGFESRDQCVAHVIHFLKQHEKSLLSHGLTGELIIMYGDYQLKLGDYDHKKGVAKKKKPDEKDRD